MKLTVIPIIVGALGTIPKNWGNWDCPDNRITGIGEKALKSAGELDKFVVTQKNRQLKLVRKLQ